MDRKLFVALAFAILVTTPFGAGRASIVHAASAHRSVATQVGDTQVPLESLPAVDPYNVIVIPPGNRANFQGQPLMHGLQASSPDVVEEAAHALFKLNKGYNTFAADISRLGTAYVDDSGDCSVSPCTITFYDDSAIQPDSNGKVSSAARRVIFLSATSEPCIHDILDRRA